jgi:hypothetical protein
LSKISLTGNASGTGTLTIAAPNTDSDRTLTLPDNSGTVLTSATTTGFPAGSVLQVVQASTSTVVATTSATPADTGLSGSITPTSASSKILVIVSQAMNVSRGTNNYNAVQVQLLRGATTIQNVNRVLLLSAGTAATGFIELGGRVDITYLDSPNTTSATTYKTQFNIEQTANSGAGNAQPTSTPSTITLMEIAA